MFIKIKKATKKTYWYKHCIDLVFEVEDNHDANKWVLKLLEHPHFIDRDDALVISDDKYGLTDANKIRLLFGLDYFFDNKHGRDIQKFIATSNYKELNKLYKQMKSLVKLKL